MDPRKSIYWHEGLFLRPQHFQQQDYYQQMSSYRLIKQVSPFHWGVKSLSIVQAALNNQIIEISGCEIVFPDGTQVHYPGDAVIERRSIEGRWDVSGKPMPIYIGVKKLSPGKNNVSGLTETKSSEVSQASFDAARYCVGDVPVSSPDFYDDNKFDDVYYLEHNLQIFIGDEASQAVDFTLVKIAELQRFGSEVMVSKSYIPPVIDISGSSVLLSLLRDINEQITSQGRGLAQYKRDIGIEYMDFSSKDMIYLLALKTLNGYIPLLRHQLESGAGSPWQLYGTLRQLVGELSTYSSDYDVFGSASGNTKQALPEYKHDDLGLCFSSVAKLVTNLINEIMAGPDYTSTLIYDGTYFQSELEEKLFQGNNQYYLCVQSELQNDQCIQLFESLSKLSSRQHLPLLIARSLTSVDLEHDPTPPTELPRSGNKIYFKINNHGTAWDAVRDSLNMAVYFESPPSEMEIQLMVVYA